MGKNFVLLWVVSVTMVIGSVQAHASTGSCADLSGIYRFETVCDVQVLSKEPPPMSEFENTVLHVPNPALVHSGGYQEFNVGDKIVLTQDGCKSLRLQAHIGSKTREIDARVLAGETAEFKANGLHIQFLTSSPLKKVGSSEETWKLLPQKSGALKVVNAYSDQAQFKEVIIRSMKKTCEWKRLK